jgi:hypothetical protein
MVRPPAYLLFSLGFLVICGNSHGAPAPLERSVSASRQFIVYGTTMALRGAIADVAEKTKTNVLNLLRQEDEWKTPVILNLQFPQANLPELPAAALRFSQTGAGLKIQLDLTITRDFDPLAVRRQILRATLLEMIYRHAPDLPAGSAYVDPPEWLIEGLLAADPLRDRTGVIDTISSVLAQNNIMTVDEFLAQKFGLLDPSGQRLYRAYSFGLLQLLMSDAGGAPRLAGYLNGLSLPSADPVADLRTWFPVLGRGKETDSVWRASLVSLTTRRYEMLTAAETERQLANLLGTSSSEDIGTNNALGKFVKKKALSRPELNELRQLREKLLLLGVQANPSFGDLIMEYQSLAERLLKHKSKEIRLRLSDLAAKRKQIAARVSDMDDYLNWYEATKADTASGAFIGYLRAADQSDEPRSRRRDPISVYLDALEEQF